MSSSPGSGSAHRLLSAAINGKPLSEWALAEVAVAEERAAIEAWLADGGRAYGFTSILGHLADGGSEAEGVDASRSVDEGDLLRSHLVADGLRVDLSRLTIRCIVGAKITQLARGGSGISPSTYRAFLSAWRELSDVSLPLDASYSCGDVVPGAWLLSQVTMGRSLEVGDVIAGINGTHISTGVSTVAFGIVSDAADRLLAHLRTSRLFAVNPRRLQLPVSLREDDQLFDLMVDALESVEGAIDVRLSHASANPLFAIGPEGHIVAHSTSAFLDHRLSSALLALRESLLLCVEHLVALHVETERAHGTRRSLTLQFPKVLRALQARLLQRVAGWTPRTHPVGGAGEGLEDVADYSLHLSLDIIDLSARVDALLEIARHHHRALGLTPDPSDGVRVGERLGPEQLKAVRAAGFLAAG